MPGGSAATDLRVLHLVTDRDRRGAQVFGWELARGLEMLGVSNSILALAPGDHGDDLPIETAGPSRRSPRTVRRVRRRAHDHDVVVAHGSTTLFVAAAALAGSGVPFVYRQISDPRHWAATRARRLRVAGAIGRAARVIALSADAGDVVRRHYRLDVDRIAVIPNAVPADDFPDLGPCDPGPAKHRAGFPSDAPVVLFLGALVVEKGADAAIRAVAANPGAHLLVAGDGNVRAELENLAERVAPGRVRFAGSVASPLDALRTADLVVLPSRGGDSMPAALIEAGLSGLATIATPVGSITEVVLDGRTGRIVPIDDQPALDRTVAELVGDPRLRRCLGRAARQHCLDNFTIESTAPRWLAVLSEVATRNGRARRGGRRRPRS